VSPAGAITQAGLTLGGEALTPLADRAPAGAERRRDGGHGPACGQALDQRQSILRRRGRILIGVHPGLRLGG